LGQAIGKETRPPVIKPAEPKTEVCKTCMKKRVRGTGTPLTKVHPRTAKHWTSKDVTRHVNRKSVNKGERKKGK
jgi:hypothetical protein